MILNLITFNFLLEYLFLSIIDKLAICVSHDQFSLRCFCISRRYCLHPKNNLLVLNKKKDLYWLPVSYHQIFSILKHLKKTLFTKIFFSLQHQSASRFIVVCKKMWQIFSQKSQFQYLDLFSTINKCPFVHFVITICTSPLQNALRDVICMYSCFLFSFPFHSVYTFKVSRPTVLNIGHNCILPPIYVVVVGLLYLMYIFRFLGIKYNVI